MSTTTNDEHWLELITKCRSSELTDRQWCIENGILVSTFYYHVRTLRKTVCEVPESVDTAARKDSHYFIERLIIFCVCGKMILLSQSNDFFELKFLRLIV